MHRTVFAGLLAFVLSSLLPAQNCTNGTLLKNDSLPNVPTTADLQNTIFISSLCVGGKAGSILDISAFSPQVTVHQCSVAFTGLAGALNGAATLQIFDGVTIAANGSATMGPLLYTSPSTPLQANGLTVFNVMSLAIATSDKLVVAFTMDANPNEPLPGLGCFIGYSASFATDVTALSGPCSSAPGTNLIFAPAQGWFDVTQYLVSGSNWCGLGYNGNWIIRACVEPTQPEYPGTREDFIMLSSVGLNQLSANDIKTVTAGQLTTIFLDSPNTSYSGLQLFLAAEGFVTGSPPISFFPGTQLSATANTVLVVGSLQSPFGVALLPPIGFGVSFLVPPGLNGLRVRATITSRKSRPGRRQIRRRAIEQDPEAYAHTLRILRLSADRR